MQLPSEILDNSNLSLSRHKDPAALDWQQIRGEWIASDGLRCYVIIHDEKLGYVIAEKHYVYSHIVTPLGR